MTVAPTESPEKLRAGRNADHQWPAEGAVGKIPESCDVRDTRQMSWGMSVSRKVRGTFLSGACANQGGTASIARP